MVCGIPGKGYKILLSLAPIVMETILAANFLEKFSVGYFLFDANKKNIFFKGISYLTKTKKGRRPYLCQLFTCACPMSTLVEPNLMILTILIYQLQYWKAASVSRNIVHLFVSKLVCTKFSSTLFPLWGGKKDQALCMTQLI